ncbi:hypothetical protein LWI29_028632 [Acer saccharum]|uniref:Uncharacterized protein n=1 Tax=Acer saccharum TaxID=4024 RepID=A0AA39VEG4_ACESA|nr:hypothetical protein LWI29_028632 [Acer saccharum]
MVDVGKVRVNLCLDGRARGELDELALGSPKEASTFWTRELSELRAICLGSPWARFGSVLKNPESLAGLGRAWGDLLELALGSPWLETTWSWPESRATSRRAA